LQKYKNHRHCILIPNIKCYNHTGVLLSNFNPNPNPNLNLNTNPNLNPNAQCNKNDYNIDNIIMERLWRNLLNALKTLTRPERVLGLGRAGF